jgi:hypothetical protein
MPRKRKQSQIPEDRPMTVAEWEAFMRESDLRSARYGELLETLHEDPDCHEKIDHEMGWDREDEAMTDEEREQASRDIDEMNRVCEEALTDPEIEAEMRASDHALNTMPAYILANEARDVVHDVLKPYARNDDGLDDDSGELIGEAFIGIAIASAKIAGGHGMGYSDDSIGGNVVNCKRALAGARQSIEALEQLVKRKILSSKQLERVMPALREAERAIEARIAELRARMWWDK